MVSPLVFIHPSEQHIQQIDQQFLIERVGLLVLLEIPDDFVGDVDDFSGFAGLPVGV